MTGLAAGAVGRTAPALARAACHVLHIIAPGETGGAEQVVQALATGQRRGGVRVSVLAVLGDGREEDHPFVRGLGDAGVDAVGLRVPPRGYWQERVAVLDACGRLRPQVVHTHGYRADIVSAGAARRLGIPTITTVHGFTGGDWKNRIYERLQRRALRRFAAVVAVSRPLAHQLSRAGVANARLHLVPNAWAEGGSPLARDDARRRLAVASERFHIGWVGRLAPEKGPDVFLAAVRLLGDLPVTASVLGEGRARPRLEARAVRDGLAERVRWYGIVPEARRLFTAFDVFVLSSRTEGTPIVLFEAMAAEVPIVATTVGGVPDVVSTQEALLVPADDPAALADAVRRVHAEPAAAAARARRARARLTQEFALAPWLERYEAIYRSLR
ncbi:MAG TPA: glycosyltransferase [Gemmatimonadales bacterium]|nr:glycosyltransferase [Gemmatimonadales bacterium]